MTPPPATTPDTALVFDRALVRARRDRAAAGFDGVDFLFRTIAERLAERTGDIRRAFPRALDLGAHSGLLGAALRSAGVGRDMLVSSDLSPAFIARGRGVRVVADEELLPFAENSFDLIASALSLHWVNDLPGALVQINRALAPDGAFLAALFGPRTLHELRRAWAEAEQAIDGGVSPRVSPFVDLRAAGGLLQRAGFALPVADAETITVDYPDPLTLMRELRAMGESNALLARRTAPTGRATLMAAAERYHALFAGPEGRVPATFEIVYLLGWAPHPSQQKPLKPGSATMPLAAVLAQGNTND